MNHNSVSVTSNSFVIYKLHITTSLVTKQILAEKTFHI